jgi:hypothetical protein
LADTVEAGFPSGPWVLVVGMHRSGTSAITGALGRLGLAVPAPHDLVTGRPDNPVHFESRALTDVDDAVLRAAGGTWSAPPLLAPGWERAAAVQDVMQRAGRAARRAFPGHGPVVWKDPRTCLLLPLWRAVLPGPVTVVFVWRSPLAVARSLGTRQGFTVSHGLALWERYNRAALAALAGHEVFVVRYEDMLAGPDVTLRGLAGWLEETRRVPGVATEEKIASSVSSVSEKLSTHDGEGVLPDVVRHAVDHLSALGGVNECLAPVELPVAPPWMGDAITQRRDYERLYARYLRYVKWRRKIPILGSLSWGGGD